MKIILLSCLCVSVGSASAQGGRDRVEKASDRKALRVDARERRDDRRDTAGLEILLARFDAARARNDSAALAVIERELKTRVERELAESRFELRKDAQEVQQGRRELATDRGGVRDDRRDALVEAGGLLRVKAINAELGGLVGKGDAASLDRAHSLLVELIRLGWNELGQDRREAREDHRELREDRL